MKFLSLFAGIGGFDLGLERAGMQCVGQVEIDPFCQAVLAHHWPHVRRIDDIRKVRGNEFGTVDLICGGFPCQPFSLAGQRAGAKDDRYLWPEMCRIIQTCRPAWVLGENVAGIIGVELDKVLSDLESIGYAVQCFVIPACAVDAPHRRDRVWIVAHTYANGWESGSGNSGVEEGSRKPYGGNAERLCETVAHTTIMRMEGERKSWFCEPSGLAEKTLLDGRCQEPRAAEWKPEPNVGRLAHGVPNRMAQLHALGNAVVPQVVETIGREIIRAHVVCAERLPDTKERAAHLTTGQVSQ